MTGSLPSGADERNAIPLADGLLYYFPNALAEVARVSKIGNDQHNPGQPMHWARGKSTDHANKILRHLIDAGTRDSDGTRHSAKVAWRALALLQEELEREEGVPLPRNARLPETQTVVLADGVTAVLVQPSMAARMARDGIVLPDDDESPTPAEPPREHA